VGIAGLNNNTIHSYVSRDTGLFRKYGLDARLVVFQAGSLLAQASMAGGVKVSMIAGPVTIASRSAGSDSIVVASVISTVPYKMIVAKDIVCSDQLNPDSAVEGETKGKAQVFRCEGTGSVPLRKLRAPV